MATTVANFSAIDDTEVDADSPITETLVTRLRDNSYWIDPATTRTTATSNTLVLTPNQTAGTTQWQEVGDIAGVDGTKGTATIAGPTWNTITTLTSGILELSVFGRNDGEDSWGNIKVDLSDDTYCFSGFNQTAGAGYSGTGTVTTGSNMWVSETPSEYIQIRRDSGNFQIRIGGTPSSSSVTGNWVIL